MFGGYHGWYHRSTHLISKTRRTNLKVSSNMLNWANNLIQITSVIRLVITVVVVFFSFLYWFNCFITNTTVHSFIWYPCCFGFSLWSLILVAVVKCLFLNKCSRLLAAFIPKDFLLLISSSVSRSDPRSLHFFQELSFLLIVYLSVLVSFIERPFFESLLVLSLSLLGVCGCGLILRWCHLYTPW